MKKNYYEAPAMEVVKVEVAHFLAASQLIEMVNGEFDEAFFAREGDFEDEDLFE